MAHHYPVISIELVRRKWGLARSKANLERASKTLMIQSDHQFKLIGQLLRPGDGSNTVDVKLTSDGLRTIIINGIPQRVTSSSNYPAMDDIGREPYYVRYDLQGEIRSNLHDFVFSDNERQIIYLTDEGLRSMDLETGKITVGPDGDYNRQLFKFHGNTMLVAQRQPFVLSQISTSSTTTTTNHHTSHIQLQNLCAFKKRSFIYSDVMDVNPFDYSTMAIVDDNNRLYLYNTRELLSCGPIPSQPMKKLGKKDVLFSMCLPGLETLHMKFSPSGSKIAVQIWEGDEEHPDGWEDSHGEPVMKLAIIVYNVNDWKHPRRVDATHPFDRACFCWYDEENVCFSRSDVVTWNINTKKVTRLFPSCGAGVYVHPRLPLIANFEYPSCFEPDFVYKLWAI